MATDPTREELVALCERAVVPMDFWDNRDSSSAQMQVGQAWALLRAGAPFTVLHEDRLKTDENTIWVEIEWHGFDWFELGSEDGGVDDSTFYIPTAKRLERAAGDDWY